MLVDDQIASFLDNSAHNIIYEKVKPVCAKILSNFEGLKTDHACSFVPERLSIE